MLCMIVGEYGYAVHRMLTWENLKADKWWYGVQKRWFIERVYTRNTYQVKAEIAETKNIVFEPGTGGSHRPHYFSIYINKPLVRIQGMNEHTVSIHTRLYARKVKSWNMRPWRSLMRVRSIAPAVGSLA